MAILVVLVLFKVYNLFRPLVILVPKEVISILMKYLLPIAGLLVITIILRKSWLHYFYREDGPFNYYLYFYELIVNALLIFIAIRFINRFERIPDYLTKNILQIEQKRYLILPLFLLLFGWLVNSRGFGTYHGGQLVLFFIICISVGLSEELIFRGFIFTQVLDKKTLLPATAISSVLFAGLHLLSLFTKSQSLPDGILLLGFTFSMGVFLTALMIFFRNIGVAGLMHGLFNFIFGLSSIQAYLLPVNPSALVPVDSPGNSNAILTLLFNVLLFGCLAWIGFFMLKGRTIQWRPNP